MTHLDTLRHMLAVRPCGRHCGCGGCQERSALEEAIRVMERSQDRPVPHCMHCDRETLPCCDDCRARLRALADEFNEALGLGDAAARLRTTARALETP